MQNWGLANDGHDVIVDFGSEMVIRMVNPLPPILNPGPPPIINTSGSFDY